MLTPLAVKDVEQDLTLQLAHRLFANLGFTVLKVGLNVCLELSNENTAVKTHLAAYFLHQLIRLEARMVEGAKLLPQAIEVPIINVTQGVGPRDILHDVAEETPHHGVNIFALKDATALVVHHGTLLVHDVVVLQHVLTHLGVTGLDGGLCALDGLTDHLEFQRLILRVTGRVKRAGCQSGCEQSHEVVF